MDPRRARPVDATGHRGRLPPRPRDRASNRPPRQSAMPDPLDAESLREAGVEPSASPTPTCTASAAARTSPIEAYDAVRAHGIAQTEAVMTIDLRHNVIAGFEHGFRDFWARSRAATLVRMPGDPAVAWCLAETRRLEGPFPLDPRYALRQAIAGLARHAPQAVGRARARVLPRRAADLALVRGARLVGLHVRAGPDPRGVVREILATARDSACSRSCPRRSTAAASTRSTSATARRSSPPTARSASRRWPRRWRPGTACSRRSWASCATTTRARACTSTSHARARTAPTPSPTPPRPTA